MKMKRKSFKILVLILVVLHIYIILMRWVYWMLDWNYGHFYYIEFPVNQNDTHKVLKDLHSEILFDIYYLAFSTIVTIIIAVKYLKQQKKNHISVMSSRHIFQTSSVPVLRFALRWIRIQSLVEWCIASRDSAT